MKIKAIYIILFLSGIVFNSCQKLEYQKEYNWAYPVSGDWVVNVQYGTDTYGPIYLKTYNSSFGQDSIWVDDHQDFWPMKVKAKVDMKNLSFETTKSVSYAGESTEDEVKITSGKVVKNDSIYFEAEFTSDPGIIYKFGGHRKTSYEEYPNGLN
jgi:hypothetical protein